MRSIFRIIALLLFTAWILGLFFLFNGEPDLWDKWHARALIVAEGE